MAAGKNLDPVEIPEMPRDKLVEQSFYSKAQDSVVKKYPGWDVARGTPATELLLARKALFTADERLNDKRREQAIRRAELNEKWKIVREKAQQFRQSFIKFNRFIRENEEKRERADRKIAEERAFHVERDADIEAIKNQLDFMSFAKNKIKQNYDKLKIYEDYLKNVVAESSQFKIIADVINRYETLIDARQELADKQLNDIDELESVRGKMMQMLEHNEELVMLFNTRIGVLHSRYKKARLQSLQWEHALEKTKQLATQRMMDLDQVQKSCWNLYSQICKHKGIPLTIKPDNYEEQCLFIKSAVTELKKAVRRALKQYEKETASLNASNASRRK